MTNIRYTPEEPIAAIATALAPGAIGIVRASGKDCIEKICAVFSRPGALKEAAGNSLVYGWLRTPTDKEKIDEVMLGVYRAPKSYTGEDMVEIFCHGGVRVVNAVLELLLANGFRQAERGEFTFRAYINGKTDLTRAEAVREIIDSKTDSSRGHAVGRLSGSLYEEIGGIKKLVTDTLASIEVEIEYPEDEETISDTFNESDLVQAVSRLQTLVSSWKSERLYQDGARVVLCGRTNAGKSSLFNALLKEDRAIVSDIAGTTRDYLECWASFDGIPVRLFDTAGLRSTSDVIEAEGVERTRDLSSDADIVLYVADCTSGLTQEDEAFIRAQHDVPVVLVWNKTDKTGAHPLPPAVDGVDPGNLIAVSAHTGENIGTIVSTVATLLSGTRTDNTENRTGLGSRRQRDVVAEALERAQHALATARSGEYGLDAVVQDLEDCLDSLGAVTGQVTPDDVLDSVFSRFCVGK